ncbi:MAG: hypothetical protein IJV95_01325 [Clostridia bacterium]|nr:hypothetical protein [Clostridia bacterium]
MWYYVKQGLLPFVYLFFTAITAFGILCIEGLVWLKVILLLLNIGLYVFIVAASSFKDGQEALKVRIANDLERLQIIRTGESLPLKLKEEYKPWKGFFNGFVACIPLLILLIIHTIVYLSGGGNGAGAIAGFIYMMVFAFSRLNIGAVTTPINPAIYYWSLLAIPLIVLAAGIPYILGAKKIELQQQRIKEKQRSIYGD